jgi:hypothetical protein
VVNQADDQCGGDGRRRSRPCGRRAGSRSP